MYCQVEKGSVVAMVESVGEISSEIVAIEYLSAMIKKDEYKIREGTKRATQIIKSTEIDLTRMDWYNSFSIAK